MNILHVLAFAKYGGCERNVVNFINASLDYNHLLIVLDKEDEFSKEWSMCSYNVTYLNIISKDLYAFTYQLSKFIKTQSFDKVIVWTTIRMPLVRFAFRKFNDTLVFHCGNPVKSEKITILKNKILNFILPCKVKTHIACCSNFVKESFLKDNFYKKFSTTTIHNAVNTLKSNPYNSRDLNENSSIQIGMVARLDEIKDHFTIIKAFSRVLKIYPNAQLHLCGDGHLKKELKIISHQLSINRNIFFHGTQKDIYSFLQQWDLFLYSTTNNEGFGISVAEAMANGLPCILSDLPMLKEVALKDEVEWAHPKDINNWTYKIQELIKNKNQRKDLSVKAFAGSNNRFSESKFVNKYLSL